MKKRQPGVGLSNRYRSLLERHTEIDNQISVEMARPLPDFLAIQSLKRQRLKTKDELESLGGVMRTVSGSDLPGAA
jgi:hypothetical protein